MHVPDHAVADQLAHGVDGRAVDERVARHQQTFVGGGELGQLVSVPQARGQGLLDEHVLAGLQRALGQGVMGWVVAITTASIVGSTSSASSSRTARASGWRSPNRRRLVGSRSHRPASRSSGFVGDVARSGPQ